MDETPIMIVAWPLFFLIMVRWGTLKEIECAVLIAARQAMKSPTASS